MHNSATDRRRSRLQCKPPPARKPALQTILSSGLRCESAAEHHTAEQYSKTGRTKLQKNLRMSDRLRNTCQDFLIIPSLMSWSTGNRPKVLLKGHLSIKGYPNITRSADFFSTVPSRVNGVNRGWTVRDLETIIVLVLHSVSFTTSYTTH